ncbi:helix-turn-helix transcriptional regulator [Paenibacillus sp. FSL R10-2782]|uniref:helix-turn-helix domain-containing protein n=1 Tax=Paenibacillus sp. FSL R10-2782 TaxID=2954661 RepID=UPI00315927AD
MVLPIAVAPGFLNQAKKVEIRAQRRTLSLVQHHSAHFVLVQLGADFLQVSQTTYSRYENGNLDVPSVVLIKLADFHKVSIDFILDQTDNPKRTGKKA